MYAAAAGAAAAYSLPPHMHQMNSMSFSQAGQLLTQSPAVSAHASVVTSSEVSAQGHYI